MGALTRVFSPTRLESWSKCPFQFFLGNVLSLSAWENARRRTDDFGSGSGHVGPQDTGAFHQRNSGVRPAVRGDGLGHNSHQQDRGHRRGRISRGRGTRRHRAARPVGGGQGRNHPRPRGFPGERYGTAGPIWRAAMAHRTPLRVRRPTGHAGPAGRRTGELSRADRPG